MRDYLCITFRIDASCAFARGNESGTELLYIFKLAFSSFVSIIF